MAGQEEARTLKKRIAIIGVGGASNSGKTTLAKHLRRLLKNSTIIHLDDFAPAQEKIPYSPLYPDLQDWDTPATAIDWPLLRSSLDNFKQTGRLPGDHQSHDHLNKLEGVSVSEEVEEEAKRLIKETEEAALERGEELQWGILDGFLLYWDPDVLAQIDVRLFLRVPYATLKRRRESRNEYVTQTGDVWRDPPNYFDQIVYPAYVLAHSSIFSPSTVQTADYNLSLAAERVETAQPNPEWVRSVKEGGKGLTLVRVDEGSDGMSSALKAAVEALSKRFGVSDV